MKKVFTLLGKVIALITLLFAAFVMLLTVLDYDPDIVTKNDITSNSDLMVENEFSITTWNLGYAGLSSDTVTHITPTTMCYSPMATREMENSVSRVPWFTGSSIRDSPPSLTSTVSSALPPTPIV